MLRAAGTLLSPEDAKPVTAAGTEPFSAPPWVVGSVGGAVVLSGVLYFVWRVRSARRIARSAVSVRPPASKIR